MAGSRLSHVTDRRLGHTRSKVPAVRITGKVREKILAYKTPKPKKARPLPITWNL